MAFDGSLKYWDSVENDPHWSLKLTAQLPREQTPKIGARVGGRVGVGDESMVSQMLGVQTSL